MRFPKRNIDVSLYYAEISLMLNDNECAIFIDTNIISQLYRLNDEARQDFYKWVENCGDRFHIPVWAIHEYSDKVYQGKTKDYLSEISKIKNFAADFTNIIDFVKGYVGEALLEGSIYQGKVEKLKEDIDSFAKSLKKINTAISNNIENHQRIVHEEIVAKLESKILDSDIYSIVTDANDIYSQRSLNRIPPGYNDGAKAENKAGDYIIWREILEYCKTNNIKKAILITRDQKSDITYSPDNQIMNGVRPAGKTERVKIARNSLIHEFYTQTLSEKFYIIDFKTFVTICASQYTKLAISFQLSTAEEDRKKQDKLSEKKCSPEFSNNDKVDEVLSLKEKEFENDSILKYAGTALVDGQYENEANNGCMDSIITQLKTYNWNEQNPAIDKITRYKRLEFPDTLNNRSSVFVLGRNILQAAEGSAGNAISFIENISEFIKNWSEIFKQALIDGMLFEVYFNSEGKIRPLEFKATYFEDIISNINKLKLKEPYEFINEQISKEKSRFVPFVGRNKLYKFVFAIDNDGNTIALSCDGINISNTFKRSLNLIFSTKEKIKSALSSYYGINEKEIEVEGLKDNINNILYIEEPWELPF